MKIKIDKRIIPIPSRAPRKLGASMYPFKELKKGQSFTVTLTSKKQASKRAKQLGSYVWALRTNGTIPKRRAFTVRAIGKIVRAWRIK